MQNHLIRSQLQVKASPTHGYGVFSKKRLKSGNVIEECTIIPFEKVPSELTHFVFKWQELSAFPLGYGALYNHSDNPNANYFVDQENGIMRIVANRMITKGEEIFIHYGENWFETHKIKKLTCPPFRNYRQHILYPCLGYGLLFSIIIFTLFFL